MELEYTCISDEVKISTYEILIDYEHGDADERTNGIKRVNTKEELINYIGVFNLLAKQIDDNRAGYSDLPKNFQDIAFEKGVEIESDIVYRNADNYFAQMNIDNIIYYDENGKKFRVEIKD